MRTKLRPIVVSVTLLALPPSVAAQAPGSAWSGTPTASPEAAVARTADVGTLVPTRPAPTSLLGFGAAVAIAGDELLVGRPGEIGFFPMPPAQAGAVHVFRRGDGGAWEESRAVSGSGVSPGDGFGFALATNGEDLLVVGAPKRAEERGVVYLFRRDAEDGWKEVARLEAPGGEPGDRLGSAVALAGELLVAGAPGRDDGKGGAHVFRRDPATGSWAHAAALAPEEDEGAAAEARFGAAVAVSRGRVFVGVPGPASPPGFLDQPPPQRPGEVLVYAIEAGTPRLEARLSGPEGEASGLGYALAPAGDDLFAGAPTSAGFEGRVYRFSGGEGGWRRVGAFGPGDGGGPAFFGAGLAVAGSDLLVGAPFAAQGTGRVYAFPRALDAAPGARRVFDVRGKGLMSAFGAALAAAGDLAVAGAPAADFFEGRVYLYARDPASGEWSRAGDVVEEAAGLDAVTGGEVECADGSAGDFPCDRVDLVAFLPVEAIGGRRGVMLNDLWGWTDPETGREYAIVGRFDGTSFVDVSDPASPVYLGNLPLHEGAQPNLWRDMKVYAGHAFIVADGAGPHGMQVFDLTRLRDVEDPPVTFTEDAHYDRVHSVHNLAIDPETGFAYAVSASMGGETCGGALHMIDIRDPREPSFAGCFADPRTGSAGTGGTHDTQCVVYRGPDEEHRGREICFSSSETALGIADVTDKENPRPLAAAGYPNVAYAHQGWLSEDHRYFFLNDELDEISGTVPRTRTLVWDVTDLDDPVLAAEHLGTTGATDHNLYVSGRYMYQSNYVAGLRIFDVSDPEDPVEVGWFDTVPFGPDSPGFAGSWSNYPFFESGVIVVTSMREGLFILRKVEPRVVS